MNESDLLYKIIKLLGDIMMQIGNLRLEIMDYYNNANKYKQFDLTKEAEESRAAYKRWKEEKGGKGGKGQC